MDFRLPKQLSASLAVALTATLPSSALVLRVFDPVAHLRINNFPSSPTVNPKFLNPSGSASSLLDLTGVGWSVQDPTKQLTLVSPRHFVGANHFRPAVGSTVRFLAKDNTLHDATIASISTIPNPDNSPSDVFLGEFAADLPAAAAVLPLPYLNLATESAYVGETLVIAGQAARGGRGVIGSVSDFGGDPITGGAGITTRAFTFSYGQVGSIDDCHAQGGDSGSPSFAIRSGKAALVGTHTAVLSALGTTTTYDTLVPHYAPELNLRMESTGLHLRKIAPPATTLSATGSAVSGSVRAKTNFVFRISVTTGTALAENVIAKLTLPAGLSASGLTAPGWVATGASSLRRGAMAAGQSVQFELALESTAAAGNLEISLVLKSDGSAERTIQLPVTVLPSFAEWTAGLADVTTSGDSDQDGISNLVEYASGGDGRTNSQYFPGSTVPLLPQLSGSPLGLDYLRRVDAASRGLLYHVEFSDTLAASAWQSADGLPASVSPGPSAGFEKVRVGLSQAPGGKRFYRLRIELAE